MNAQGAGRFAILRKFPGPDISWPVGAACINTAALARWNDPLAVSTALSRPGQAVETAWGSLVRADTGLKRRC